MKNASIPTLLLLALGTAACSSTPTTPQRVNKALLSDLTRQQLAPVKIAESEFRIAKEHLENAVRQAKLAAEAVTIARSELGVASERVDAARVALGAARQENIETNIDAASVSYLDLLAQSSKARLKLALTKRENDVATLRRAAADEKVALAEAELMLARAQALANEELTPSESVPMEDLVADVLFRRAESDLASDRLDRGRVALEKARDAYESFGKGPAAGE